MCGEAHAASLYPDGEDKKRIEALQTSLSKSKYSTNKIAYLSWAKYFEEGDEMNNTYQVDAFQAYLAIVLLIPELAKMGYRASCLRRQYCLLRGSGWRWRYDFWVPFMLVRTSAQVVRSVGRYEVVNYANTNFLQQFRLDGALSSITIEFKPVKLRMVDRVKKIKPSLLKCR